MNWIEINIYTSTEAIDLICGNLLDIGIKGAVIKDSADFNEFLENKDGKWDYLDEHLMKLSDCETCITVYVPENSQGNEMLIALKAMLKELSIKDLDKKFGRLEIELQNVCEEDWANNWKQYFKPLHIGENLIVKPSWESLSEDISKKIILEIDPASSFGSGQHHTTKLCLEILEKNINKDDKVLDIGCGSGILSIASILLGAKSCTAIDIEENSVKTAIENALKNDIDREKYTAYYGNILNDNELVSKIDTDFDMITANIVSDVLIAMNNLFKNFLKDNGILIVSGIISERKDEVISHLSINFNLTETFEEEDWVALKFIKK